MIYFLLFISSFTLTYFIKNYAIKKSLVAQVTDRSSHSTPTPHGGGIAIALTWFFGISYLYYTNDIDNSLYFALMLGLVISFVSYLDDLYELSAKLRILVQGFVSGFGLYLLGGFENFDLIIFSTHNQIFTNIFAFFMIVWFINLYNFLDGIDGYAGSEAIFLALGGFILFGDTHFLFLLFSVLGFLVWNWHKAKIFMGDVGSTLLGYNIAIFTIYYANQESSNFLIWTILFSLFIFDATFTLFRRYKNSEKLSQAHKKHFYQRLTQSGYSHSKVTIYSIFINIVIFSLLYFIPNILVTLLGTFIILFIIVKFVDNKKSFN